MLGRLGSRVDRERECCLAKGGRGDDLFAHPDRFHQYRLGDGEDRAEVLVAGLVVLVEQDVDAAFEDVRLRDTDRWDGVGVLLQRGEFVFGLGD